MTRPARQLALGAFLMQTGHHIAGWRHPDAQADAGSNFRHYVELARLAEAAKFDTIFFADSSGIRSTHPAIACAHGPQRLLRSRHAASGARRGDRTLLAARGRLIPLLARLPADVPLGLYECPAPYRRLLSDDELKRCIDTGRFMMLKDVSCDLDTVKRRVALAQGSPLKVLNANAVTARDAMKAGSAGFDGVFTNFHPDLYKCLRERQPASICMWTTIGAIRKPKKNTGWTGDPSASRRSFLHSVIASPLMKVLVPEAQISADRQANLCPRLA